MPQDEKTLEFGKQRPRKEEQSFIVQYSKIQSNTLLLFILASTFLMAGVAQIVDIVGFASLRQWFIMLVAATFLFAISAAFISFSSIFNPLKLKRFMQVLSFYCYIAGMIIFFISLGALIKVLLAA